MQVPKKGNKLFFKKSAGGNNDTKRPLLHYDKTFLHTHAAITREVTTSPQAYTSQTQIPPQSDIAFSPAAPVTPTAYPVTPTAYPATVPAPQMLSVAAITPSIQPSIKVCNNMQLCTSYSCEWCTAFSSRHTPLLYKMLHQAGTSRCEEAG